MHSETTKQKIAKAVKKSHTLRKARKEAFEGKDQPPKRSYKKRVVVAEVQMQGMVNELELFIAKLPTMTATEYLEARANLIKNILNRGRKQ